MIKRNAAIAALLAALALGSSNILAAEAQAPAAAEPAAKSACEQQADAKKITDAKKRADFIKKCEAKKSK